MPAASVAWNTTLLVPTGKAEPLGRPLTRTAVPLVGVQLSVNVGAAKVVVAEQAFDGVVRLIAAGHVKDGACVSLTTTRNVQVLLKPAASVALHVTVVGPLAKVALLFGLPVAWPAPPLTHCGCPEGRAQLSVAVGVGYEAKAVHWSASMGRVMLPGQAIVGTWVSFTVTVNEQVAVFAVGVAVSVTFHSTTVVPFGNCEPLAVLAALWSVTTETPQLSVAVGVV